MDGELDEIFTQFTSVNYYEGFQCENFGNSHFLN